MASYLVTTTEQELRILNTGILSIRKWLRKRHEALKNLQEPRSGKVVDGVTLGKKLVAEAKKQQEVVGILLDRGHWFLLQHANIVLESDLENLIFLWNAYVEGLRKLYISSTVGGRRDSGVSVVRVDSNRVGSEAASLYPSSENILINPFCSKQESNTNFSKSDSATLRSSDYSRDLSIEIDDSAYDLSNKFSDSTCDISIEISDSGIENSNTDDVNAVTNSLKTSELLLPSAASVGKEEPKAFDSLALYSDSALQHKFSYTEENGSLTTSISEDNSGDDENCLLSLDFGISTSFLSSYTEKMDMDKSVNLVAKDMENNSTQLVTAATKKGSSEPPLSHFDSEFTADLDSDSRTDVGSLITFDIPGLKVTESVTGDLPSGTKRRRMLLDAPVSTSNLSSRSESPLSLDSSRSETPTGTLTRAERQNELWRAIGSIDAFLMDKDILEACKSTANDLYCEDDDFVGAPNVSFAEFLQQYKELMDWLNQVHKVTQREVTSLSEKYLNQNYHEEMLERSPRREFINNYSHQLLLRYPNMADQISARMNRLNLQWVAVEQAIAPKHGRHDADTMLQDLECDLKTLRRWLNAVETRLLSLTIKAEWTDAELEERLQEHQALQREIESHNKIVNAVLKLSERLERDYQSCGNVGDRHSLQLVALNLERRWHGIWLQSLEWQCRLEEAISRRENSTQKGFDFSGFLLPVLDESLFNSSSQDISDQGLIELDDDSLLFIGHRDDFTDSTGTSTDDEHKSYDFTARIRPGSSTPEAHGLFQLGYGDSEAQASSDQDGLAVVSHCRRDSSSGADTPTEPKSPTRPSAFFKPDSPLGKRPFPDFASGEASPAKKGSQSPSSSSGGLSPVVQRTVLESFINSRGLYINSRGGLSFDSLHEDSNGSCLRLQKSLLDRSSGDSANISESESKMGDSPPSNNRLADSPEDLTGYVVTSSDGEGDTPMVRSCSKTEVRDIGYSSESQSNDEVEVMHHQINMEYKFPGKCEVASDGPLGEKVALPSVAVRQDYYYMTLVDIDSTDKTDNGDTTDSGGERVKKIRNQEEKFVLKDASDSDDFRTFINGDYSDLKVCHNSESLEDSWEASHFPSPLSGIEYLKEKNHLHIVPDQPHLEDRHNGFALAYELLEFSESDSAPESREKKSIRYLIEHAEDLIKPPSPKHSCPPSPSKHHLTLTSPSKHTQTDSNSTVESSCDASGEDNSEYEGLQKRGSAGEGFSTATDDADETLFNSMINLESATESVKNAGTNHVFSSPASSLVYDSPRLRKQTGGNPQRRGKKDRPWSVVGLEDTGTSKKIDSFVKTVAASESAIDHLYFHTDTDSQFTTSHFSTFPRDNHGGSFRRAFSSCDHTSAMKSAKRKLKYLQTVSSTASTVSGIQQDDVKTSDSGSSSISATAGSLSTAKLPHGDSSSGMSPRRNHRSRRSRRRSSKEKGGSCTSPPGSSATTDSYNSAEAESESETADEYMTAPMEMATSDVDDVHNVSGSLSEHSTWDNYQMMYPTASEDPAEELLAWEPQDDLEFDDDFILSKQTKSIVTDVMSSGTRHSKLKFTKHGVPCDDSDSDLEDFHHFLDQSELALKLADQSLKKKRKNPMGTELHPNPVKYGEIIATYETNISCLENICQHLQKDDVTEQDLKRVQDLMDRWQILFALASERQEQATFLKAVVDKLSVMETLVQETEDYLSFDRFTSASEFEQTVKLLKMKLTALEHQELELKDMKKQLKEFSVQHPAICVDKYLQNLACLHKSSTVMVNKVSEHVELLENNQPVWLEYLDGQHELDGLLGADRERLHNLLCQQEYGMRVTKKDVLKELETLQSNLALYESKLTTLQATRARLTKTSDHSGQQLFLASWADLRNQLFVVSERCRQFYHNIEDDDDVLIDQQAEFGRLAVSAAALHEVFKTPESAKMKEVPLENTMASSQTGEGITRSCVSWLRSLPVHIVALMLVGGLVCALDPDILKRLANFTLTISPELRYVNGPPTI